MFLEEQTENKLPQTSLLEMVEKPRGNLFELLSPAKEGFNMPWHNNFTHRMLHLQNELLSRNPHALDISNIANITENFFPPTLFLPGHPYAYHLEYLNKMTTLLILLGVELADTYVSIEEATNKVHHALTTYAGLQSAERSPQSHIAIRTLLSLGEKAMQRHVA